MLRVERASPWTLLQLANRQIESRSRIIYSKEVQWFNVQKQKN